MIKKLFLKIYDFIQWTKKWHFCHVVFVGASFFGLAIYLYFLLFDILTFNLTSFLLDIFKIFYYYSLYFIVTFAHFLFVPAIIIQIFFVIFNLIRHKKVPITSDFLLNNKKYNIVYVFAFLITIFLYLFKDLMFNIIKNNINN